MGKRNLLLGVFLGAIIGGLTALFNRETRYYTKNKMSLARNRTNYYVKHPSETIHSVRVAFDRFNESFTSGAENAINALEQVENTLDKISKKETIKIDKTE
ncbi:YtxH domain-containing protein [Virgibacillus byunsanensis]|uniref:YtxH domain-containing protein n=1 Tax=Virgibacillus byunsanensis TaxID=570945 RepID=A0ABW3LQ82_9BACI